jgi:hypothetical protein
MQGGFATLVGSLKIRLVLQEQLHHLDFVVAEGA